jgi:hypothetical protein
MSFTSAYHPPTLFFFLVWVKTHFRVTQWFNFVQRTYLLLSERVCLNQKFVLYVKNCNILFWKVTIPHHNLLNRKWTTKLGYCGWPPCLVNINVGLIHMLWPLWGSCGSPKITPIRWLNNLWKWHTLNRHSCFLKLTCALIFGISFVPLRCHALPICIMLRKSISLENA